MYFVGERMDIYKEIMIVYEILDISRVFYLGFGIQKLFNNCKRWVLSLLVSILIFQGYNEVMGFIVNWN